MNIWMSSYEQQGTNANYSISVNEWMNIWMSSYEQQGTNVKVVFLYWTDVWMNEWINEWRVDWKEKIN